MKTMLSLVAMLLFTCSAAKAQKPEIFAPGGKAIRGYDAVAFFTEGKPVMGADSLSYIWKEATWLFSSRENLERFKALPEKYAPQYGGYCAYGVAGNHKSPTKVETSTILDDKLYFNYNTKVKELWSKDQPGYIQKANENWPELKGNK
jgi:YHS domain-containing protein